jgi:hypothetical protein
MRGSILPLLPMGGQIMLWVYGGYKQPSKTRRNRKAIIRDVSFLLMAILATLIWSLSIGPIAIGLLL